MQRITSCSMTFLLCSSTRSIGVNLTGCYFVTHLTKSFRPACACSQTSNLIHLQSPITFLSDQFSITRWNENRTLGRWVFEKNSLCPASCPVRGDLWSRTPEFKERPLKGGESLWKLNPRQMPLKAARFIYYVPFAVNFALKLFSAFAYFKSLLLLLKQSAGLFAERKVS